MARDLTDLIVALSRVQSDLRALNGHLFTYPDDVPAEQTVVTLVLTLEARVQEWLRTSPVPAIL